MQVKRSWCLFTSRREACLFASKALVEAQKGYVAIEIELLAVVWAMEKFHHFLYASYFILETDQKLLEPILSKEFKSSYSHIPVDTDQDFSLPLYSKIYSLYYKSACGLLWLGGQTDTIKLPKLHSHQITNQLHAISDSLQDIRLATQEDDKLALLKHTIMTGWPSTIREVPSKIQPQWTFREELTMEDGIVLKGTCIVIPHKKHHITLNLIHQGHWV